jgi:Glutaminyl-tRNA synthetase, non-specific RNA binding region part 1
VEYLKIHDTEKLWVESDFEAAAGIGVHVTEGEIQDFVTRYLATNKERIERERYRALPGALKEISANSIIKWADSKLRVDVINKKFEDVLGPKDDRDTAPLKKVCSKSVQLLITG